MSDPRRVKLLEVNPLVLSEMLRGHPMCEVVTSFPEDGRVVRIQDDARRGVYWFLIWSASFDEVELGTIPPKLNFTATRREESDIDVLLRLVTKDS